MARSKSDLTDAIKRTAIYKELQAQSLAKKNLEEIEKSVNYNLYLVVNWAQTDIKIIRNMPLYQRRLKAALKRNKKGLIVWHI